MKRLGFLSLFLLFLAGCDHSKEVVCKKEGSLVGLDESQKVTLVLADDQKITRILYHYSYTSSNSDDITSISNSFIPQNELLRKLNGVNVKINKKDANHYSLSYEYELNQISDFSLLPVKVHSVLEEEKQLLETDGFQCK